MIHLCHHPLCDRPVPPKMLACAPHWFALPKYLRDAVWFHYRPGQEIDKRPSSHYLAVMKRCIQWWLNRDSRPFSKEYDMPKPQPKTKLAAEPREERPLVKLTKFFGDVIERKRIRSLTKKRQAASAQEKQAKVLKDKYTGLLMKYLTRAKVGTAVSLDVDGRRVLLQQGSRTYLDERMLVQEGVKASLIARCKKTVATAVSLRVIEAAEDDDDNIPF